MCSQEAKAVVGCVQTARKTDIGAYTLNGDRSNIEFDISGLQRFDLTFATLDKNGLIFLTKNPEAEDAPIFYALQLEDGYLVSLFDFGFGYMRVRHDSVGPVNDGAAHNISLKAKSRRFVRIWVDTNKDGPKVADISLTERTDFKMSKAFIGGLPMREFKPNR